MSVKTQLNVLGLSLDLDFGGRNRVSRPTSRVPNIPRHAAKGKDEAVADIQDKQPLIWGVVSGCLGNASMTDQFESDKLVA
jgi:hypothetical protein